MILSHLSDVPIVAILRGLKPDNAIAVAEILYTVGIRAVEVPMNSPEPLKSIQRIRKHLHTDCAVGAGTVTTVEACKAVLDTGSRLIISPHTDGQLIDFTVKNGGISLPGVFSPTDAFTAIKAGAHGLKLFPSATGGIPHYKAIKAVLPPEIPVLAVGGVGLQNACDWLDAGVNGLGIGSAIFKPDWSLETIETAAKRFVDQIQETP